jgi:hypothetical protein
MEKLQEPDLPAFSLDELQDHFQMVRLAPQRLEDLVVAFVNLGLGGFYCVEEFELPHVVAEVGDDVFGLFV